MDRHPRPADPVERAMPWEAPIAFLRWAVALILGGSAVFLTVLFIVAPEQLRTARGGGPVILSLLALAAWVLLSRGRIKASASVLGAGLWLYTTGIALLLGGSNSMLIIVYPVIITLAGWLLGPRIAIAVAALTAAVCFFFFQGQLRGFLPPRPPTSPALLWIVQTTVFAFSALLISFIVSTYRNRLDQVRNLGRDLALRNAEVQAREADLNRAQAVAHVGSWVYDIVGDVMRLSAETCRIFGLPEGTTGSRDSYLSRAHPQDRGALDSAWQAALKGGESFDYEHRILVGKTIRWVRHQAELEFGADGAPLRGVGTTQDVTQLKCHEAELLAARSKLEATLDAVPDLLFEVGLDGRFHDYHSPRNEILITTPRDFLGKNIPDTLPPEAADVAMSALRQAHEHGYSQGKQYQLQLPQGRMWFELSVARKPVEPGQEPRFIALARDITERKRIEDEYRTIIQASTDGFWITDSAGRILDANESICRMLGYSREEILRLAIRDIDADESPDEILARTREIIRTGSALFSARHRRKDGTILDVEVSVQYVAALGERFFVFVRDITGRKREQMALIQSEQRLRAIVETEPECVKVIDRDGQLLEMNAAGLAMLEAESVAEAQRHTLQRFLLPEYRAAFGALHERVMRGESGMLEFEVDGLKGTRRWLETHAAPMRDAAGEVIMLLGITRDVTGRKKAQLAHKSMEAQLRESQKMEALGTLAGGVAHDFNNIIAAIIGNVELARQDVGPGHVALESLEEIGKASRRGKDLVQQILAFGRRQVLAREEISLAPVVEESARLLRTTLPAGVNLRVECAPDVPAVLADATQVQQVLLNLCTNAWQAMQGQELPAAIELSLAPHMANATPYNGPERRSGSGRAALRPGRYACLTVRDTGPGMDRATRSRIFEPFFTTKPVGKGTGLGLAVVHGIAQDHEASIAVHSAPGQGASFRIYFPASQARAAVAQESLPEPRIARKENGNAMGLRGAGKSILYVDDDEAIVFLMTRMLERQGYRVSGYTDAREALAAARAEPQAFDLAVTDYNMPGLSGLEVARALRDIRAELPVALASGYITEELRAQAPAAGVRELIHKPNTVDELCEVVARLANILPV